MDQEQFTLTIEVKDDHLMARASGLRTRKSVSAMALQIFEAALASQRSRVLVDVRALKGRLGTLDSYMVVTGVFQKLRGQGIFKAAILDTHDPSVRIRFMETVARNRELNFRIFTSWKEALAWLAQPDKSSHAPARE